MKMLAVTWRRKPCLCLTGDNKKETICLPISSCGLSSAPEDDEDPIFMNDCHEDDEAVESSAHESPLKERRGPSVITNQTNAVIQ